MDGWMDDEEDEIRNCVTFNCPGRNMDTFCFEYFKFGQLLFKVNYYSTKRKKWDGTWYTKFPIHPDCDKCRHNQGFGTTARNKWEKVVSCRLIF